MTVDVVAFVTLCRWLLGSWPATHSVLSGRPPLLEPPS